MQTPIERIQARSTNLGDGLIVRRALPTRQRRMVGAWCFLDHAGPVEFEPGGGMHVGAHPHTGLQTFTWMIEGEVLHRDSLGHEQIIRPGQVNLMTAGRGIAHTEDSLPSSRRLHAAQLWIALPAEKTDCEPAFDHYPELPQWTVDGGRVTLLVGSHSGRTAPTRVYSPLVGLDVFCQQATAVTLELTPDFEYGVLPLQGQIRVQEQKFEPGEFAFLGRDLQRITLALGADARVLVLGGQPFDGPIVMWWNFVGGNRAYIEQAQRDWEAGHSRFGEVPRSEGRRLSAPAFPGGKTLV